MRLIKGIWDHGAETVVVLLVVVMVVTVFGQVFCRYVLHDSPSWTEELARYDFIWISFLGSFVAFKRRAHVIVDTLLVALPPNVQRILTIAVQLAVAVFLVVLVQEGWKMILVTSNTKATMLQVPMSYVYAAVPVSAALMLVQQAIWLGDWVRRHLVPQV
ncbi:MAG: TRAP transporter small permease [Chloroflexi bacterium]|nr:TRAP transporter small permease [Chloroflexota bacterium]